MSFGSREWAASATTPRDGRGIGVLCAAAAAAVLTLAAAAATRANAAITVYTQDRAVLASYPTVNCALATVKGKRRFTAQAKSGPHGPVRRQQPRRRALGRSVRTSGRICIDRRRSAAPLGPQLAVAGAIALPGGRGTIRVGVAIMYDSNFGDDWVSVVGRARCIY